MVIIKKSLGLFSMLIILCTSYVSSVYAEFNLSPEIENIEITGNTQGGNAIIGGAWVYATVRVPGASMLRLKEITLAYRKANATSFTTIGKMMVRNGRYGRKLPILNYGAYEVKLTAKFVSASLRDVRRKTMKTIMAFEEFNINASKECFTFDSSDEDWAKTTTVNASTNVSVELGDCPSAISNAQGKLVVNLGNASCFPHTIPGGTRSDFWKFDFDSANLTDIKSWKNIKGTAIRIASNVPVQIQPIITYTKADGSITSQVVVSDDNSPLFHEVGVGDAFFNYQDIFSDFTIPDGATVTNFKVRVFGRPVDTLLPEAFLSLDTVCPTVKNRPFYNRKPIERLPKPPFSKFIIEKPKRINFSD